MRTIGAGGKVFIGQFLKSDNYSEMNTLNQFKDQIMAEHYGLGRFVNDSPAPTDIEAGRDGYKNNYIIRIVMIYWRLKSSENVLEN